MQLKDGSNWKDTLALTGLALSLPGTLAVPAAIGYFLDGYFGTSLLLPAGLVLGIVGVVTEVAAISRRLKKME